MKLLHDGSEVLMQHTTVTSFSCYAILWCMQPTLQQLEIESFQAASLPTNGL